MALFPWSRSRSRSNAHRRSYGDQGGAGNERRYVRRRETEDKSSRGNLLLGLLLGCWMCHARRQRKKHIKVREAELARSREESAREWRRREREREREQMHARERRRPRSPSPTRMRRRPSTRVRPRARSIPRAHLPRTPPRTRANTLPTGPTPLTTKKESRVRARSSTPSPVPARRRRTRARRSTFSSSQDHHPGREATIFGDSPSSNSTMGNHGSRAQAATVPVPRIKIISPTASPSTPTHKPRAAPYNLDGPVDFEDIPAMPDHRHRRGEQSYELESDYMDRPRGRGRVARHGNDTGVRRYSPPRMEPSLSPVPRRRRSDRHQSQRKKRAESPGCSRSAKWKTLYVLAAELVICFVEPKGGWGQYHKKDKSKDARERYSAESGRRQRHRDRRGRTYYSDDESDEREYTARIIPRDLSPPDYESSNRAEVGSKRRSYR